MKDDLPVVCANFDCIYRESCLRWIENINIDDDDAPGYELRWLNQGEDDCHVPIDGQQL